MGNTTGIAVDRLACVALSHVITSTRVELMSLRTALSISAQKHEGKGDALAGKVKVTKKDLEAALTECNVEEGDREILEKMFTLFDKTGGGKVDHRSLLIGFAPVVNVNLNNRLLLAFELMDSTGRGYVTKSEMCFLLKAMNDTNNFLGDPTFEMDQIDELVESLFISTQESANTTESFGYNDNINLLAEHPIFDAWLRSSEE